MVGRGEAPDPDELPEEGRDEAVAILRSLVIIETEEDAKFKNVIRNGYGNDTPSITDTVSNLPSSGLGLDPDAA